MTFNPVNTRSAYVNLYEEFPLEDSELQIKLSTVHTSLANAVNAREISIYEDGQQIPTGQQFSTPGNANVKRLVFRKMFYFGAIAAGATLNIPHGLTNVLLYTKIGGGVVTDFPDFRPLPFVSPFAVANQIGVRVDGANIIISAGAAGSNILNGEVTLEYIYA